MEETRITDTAKSSLSAEELADEIRRLRSEGRTLGEIAQRLNVDESSIDRIVNDDRRGLRFLYHFFRSLPRFFRSLPRRLAKARARWLWQTKERARSIAHKRIRVFKDIKSISPEQRKDLTSRVIRCEAEIGLHHAREKNVAKLHLVPYYGLCVASLLVPWWVMKFVGTWYGGLAYLGIWYGTIMGGLVLFILMLIPFSVARSIFGITAGAFLSLSIFFIFGAWLYIILDHYKLGEVPWYMIIAASSMVQTFFFIIGVILGGVVLGLVSSVLAARLKRRSPDAIFIDKILGALQIVGGTDRSWRNLTSKAALMRELEGAARIASEGFPRALRARDINTDTWLKSRFDNIAASLRAKKTWVCMPNPNTRKDLEECLAKCFIDAVSGNWDGLETAERQQLTRKDIKIRIRNFLLGLFEAVLPAVLYHSAQLLGFLKPGPWDNYLAPGVVLWAVVVILLTVDSRLLERLETVQKFLSAIPGLPKKKED